MTVDEKIKQAIAHFAERRWVEARQVVNPQTEQQRDVRAEVMSGCQQRFSLSAQTLGNYFDISREWAQKEIQRHRSTKRAPERPLSNMELVRLRRLLRKSRPAFAVVPRSQQ